MATLEPGDFARYPLAEDSWSWIVWVDETAQQQRIEEGLPTYLRSRQDAGIEEEVRKLYVDFPETDMLRMFGITRLMRDPIERDVPEMFIRYPGSH